MMDGHESCTLTGEGCLRCEVIPAASGRFGDTLLLAPLDRAARAALIGILGNGGIERHDVGSMIELSCGSDQAATIDWLQERLTVSLQERIKGVFFDSALPRSPDALLNIFVHAEPLASLFDLMDVEWARTALLEERLFSVYQPILDAASGHVFGYEALIRAHHPHEDEVVGAQQLIHACGRLGLLNALDQCARVTALHDASNLNLDHKKLFMNFLPSSIYEPEVCLRTTMAAAEECGIPLDVLVFEVIETEQINDMAALHKVVDYYRQHGAGIALDDISSGFASLQYLADLVPDYAKIDRNLVWSAAENSASRHTLDSLAGLARKLNVKVIAEGIENVCQMHVCQEAGVEYMQGFLFARPAAPPEPVQVPESFRAAAA